MSVLPQTAIRRGFLDMVGRVQTWIEEPGVPTFDELLRHYGTTSGIAKAAGYGTAAEAKARGPQAVKARETFMRSLRRYRQGTRLPRADRRKLIERLGYQARRRRATPATLERIVSLMMAHGLTFVGDAEVGISSDDVDRSWPPPGWWISPAVIAESVGLAEAITGRHWVEAVEPMSNAMSTAYLGGPGMLLLSVDYLRFSIGRARGAQARGI